jgi:hypothetical protein
MAFSSDSSTDSRGSGVGSSDGSATLGEVEDGAGVEADATASFVAVEASGLSVETETGSGVPSRVGGGGNPRPCWG